MEWVSVWPTESTIRGFHIRNPKGFDAPYALIVQEIKIDYHLQGFFAEPAIIDQILCNDLIFNIDQPNWKLLFSGRAASTGVTIAKCILNNVTIRSFNPEGGLHEQHLDYLELKDIQSDQGFPLEQIFDNILFQFNK